MDKEDKKAIYEYEITKAELVVLIRLVNKTTVSDGFESAVILDRITKQKDESRKEE